MVEEDASNKLALFFIVLLKVVLLKLHPISDSKNDFLCYYTLKHKTSSRYTVVQGSGSDFFLFIKNPDSGNVPQILQKIKEYVKKSFFWFKTKCTVLKMRHKFL